MAIRVIKEVNRDAGRMVVASTLITAGQPLELAANDTVQPYSGNGVSTFPIGLASESNRIFPLQGANGLTAGAGYDYTNFNRGGLVGCFVNGGEFALSGDMYADGDADADDGMQYPYEPNDTYVLNGPVYASGSGKISSTANGAKVGTVMSVTGSAPVKQLVIKLLSA